MVWKAFSKDKSLKDPLSELWAYFLYMWKLSCLQLASFIWLPIFSSYIQLFLPDLTILSLPLEALQHPPGKCFGFSSFKHQF